MKGRVMPRMLLSTAIVMVLSLASCGEPKEDICLRQTCEERYHWTVVPTGKVFVRHRVVRTVCTCHEHYTPGEPKPENGEE
jgi:hypothetical protein